MQRTQSFISELEVALRSGPANKRIETLRRVTDLFLSNADRLSEQQIMLFDDVLCLLIQKIETKALVELSRRIAPIRQAPQDLVWRLATHDEIEVAKPVLTQSARLRSEQLVEIAKTKSQDHLLAMSSRVELDADLTDVLVECGDRKVRRTLAANSGACFSELGLAILIRRAEKDSLLGDLLALRPDLPLHILRHLLPRATEAVRMRLLRLAGPEHLHKIQEVLADIAAEVDSEVTKKIQGDYARARRQALVMQSRGELNEKTVIDFANGKRFVDVAAALSLLCAAEIDLVVRLLQHRHRDGVLVLCKGADLGWPTVQAVLALREANFGTALDDMEQVRQEYFRLSQGSAQRVLRFWQIRQTASSEGGAATNLEVAPTTSIR